VLHGIGDSKSMTSRHTKSALTGVPPLEEEWELILSAKDESTTNLPTRDERGSEVG
jgi:hypothetical protein